MRVITLNELTSRTDLEIAVLFHVASQALGRTTPGTPARRAVISSLQNIIWARTVQFLISLGFLALGFACAFAALKINMHYDFDVLYGIPLLLVVLACIFGLPFALCMILGRASERDGVLS